MRIEGHQPQRLAARRAQGGERARRERLGLGVHQDLVGEGPGMAGADAAILAGPQQHAGQFLLRQDLLSFGDAIAPRIGAAFPAVARPGGCRSGRLHAGGLVLDGPARARRRPGPAAACRASSSVGPFMLMTRGRAMAACTDRFQSSMPISGLQRVADDARAAGRAQRPRPACGRGRARRSATSTSAAACRARPGWRPACRRRSGTAEKSVSSLFSRKPLHHDAARRTAPRWWW